MFDRLLREMRDAWAFQPFKVVAITFVIAPAIAMTLMFLLIYLVGIR